MSIHVGKSGVSVEQLKHIVEGEGRIRGVELAVSNLNELEVVRRGMRAAQNRASTMHTILGRGAAIPVSAFCNILCPKVPVDLGQLWLSFNSVQHFAPAEAVSAGES